MRYQVARGVPHTRSDVAGRYRVAANGGKRSRTRTGGAGAIWGRLGTARSVGGEPPQSASPRAFSLPHTTTTMRTPATAVLALVALSRAARVRRPAAAMCVADRGQIEVVVGAEPGSARALRFSPDLVQASAGDEVVFVFNASHVRAAPPPARADARPRAG